MFNFRNFAAKLQPDARRCEFYGTRNFAGNDTDDYPDIDVISDLVVIVVIILVVVDDFEILSRKLLLDVST